MAGPRAAYRLRAEGYPVRATYTYGSPRVGNLDFYNGYTPVNYRFVNNNDLVPHVPLEFLLVGLLPDDFKLFGNPLHGLRHFVYKHVGTLKYLDRHGRLGEGTFEPAAVNDHHIWNYVRAVGSNLPGGAPAAAGAPTTGAPP